MDKLFSINQCIHVCRDLLNSCIDIIDDSVITLNEATDEKIFELCDKIYLKISSIYKNTLKISKEENEFFVENILNSENILSYPLVFVKLLSTEFSQCLLSSFEVSYCLYHSDTILIMIEYLKFLTICKIHNENFSPSSWVDQFWHHHMSFDTKQYRDFCENLFGSEIEHQEHDPSIMRKEEKLLLIEKSKRFTEIYFESFREFPPECIWPKITLESFEFNNRFVCINIYKTVLMKFLIKEYSPNTKLNQEEKELCEFSYLSEKKRSIFNSIIKVFKSSENYYKPAKDSLEKLIFQEKYTDIHNENYTYNESKHLSKQSKIKMKHKNRYKLVLNSLILSLLFFF